MKQWRFGQFGLDHLEHAEVPTPEPGPGEVRIGVAALSLNFRDLLVVRGLYNPKLALPAVPCSDAAGQVTAIGEGVSEWRVGDPVMTHFVADWQDGPFRSEYLATTLGTPGPGVASDQAIVPARALLPMPKGCTPQQAATLPIAGLTAWSALVTEGRVQPGQTVLTLGTGGVSVFAVQLGAALGARVIVTSSNDDKLARCRDLGATDTINYVAEPRWERKVLELTDGVGADVVVENGGVGTLPQSLRAVRAGGTIAMLGALTGLVGQVDIGPVLMKRVRVAGILVDSREVFRALVGFVEAKGIDPVIGARFGMGELPQALAHMQAGAHFGKIVLA